MPLTPLSKGVWKPRQFILALQVTRVEVTEQLFTPVPPTNVHILSNGETISCKEPASLSLSLSVCVCVYTVLCCDGTFQ